MAAEELKIESYRMIPTLSVVPGSRPNPSKICGWLDGAIAHSAVMDVVCSEEGLLVSEAV